MPVMRRIAQGIERRLQSTHQFIRYVSGIPCITPDFLIIGAQKGGTTSLYYYLAQHPHVSPAVHKEVHFFENPSRRGKGERWYRSFFPSKLYLACREFVLQGKVLTGEATPYMSYINAPRLVHCVKPEAKLILLLRNPVDRALSHYMHVCRSAPGLETLTFSEAIRAEPLRIQQDIDAIERDEWHDDILHRMLGYVRRGLYAQHLQQWLALFPRENIYVVESEKFYRNPALVTQEVAAFLGLSPCKFDVSEQFNVGGYAEKITPEDRAFLVDAFKDDRAELQKILGNDFGADWFD
jgi:hypothetical protein